VAFDRQSRTPARHRLAQAGDVEVAPDQHDGGDDEVEREAGVAQRDEGGGDEHFVGDVIEGGARGRYGVEAAGQGAVEPVGQCGEGEQRGRRAPERQADHQAMAGQRRVRP